jgi:ribosomal protein S18 acetylase RimI-like enzyme
MDIRIANTNDIENLYELNKLFKNENSKENMEKYISKNNQEIICIAYVDNSAVGYCTGIIIKSICYKNCRLDIESLFVKEKYRNKGIENKLINFMEKEAKSKNILHFHISTNKNNIKAKLLYEEMGYKDTGEILLDKTLNNG